MNRSQEFYGAIPVPLTVNDSRFGIRNLVSNPENSSIATYNSPGRGPNGEHQS